MVAATEAVILMGVATEAAMAAATPTEVAAMDTASRSGAHFAHYTSTHLIHRLANRFVNNSCLINDAKPEVPLGAVVC